MSTQTNRLRKIIKNNPSLLWHTRAYSTISDNTIVEAILNSGTWDQVQQVKNILGLPTLKKIFLKLTSGKRSNLRESTKNYFSHYLQTNA